MKVLSKVLWAIDFNGDHDISIDKINRVRNQFGNELVILHVLPPHIKGEASQEKITRSVEYEILNKISSRLKPGNEQTVKVRVEMGDVADQINKVAKEEKVNLVVLNKGKSSTLGAKGFRIFRKLQKPVAVLPKYSSGNDKHIVCPVDCSKASGLALKSAILHARKSDARLSVISVYRPFNLTSARLIRAGISNENERKRDLRLFKKELKTFLAPFDFSNVDAEALILEGNPEEEIIKYAKMASVLYIGSSGKRALQRAFVGSVSEKAIREAGCAVVVLKSEEVFKLNIPDNVESAERYFSIGNELLKLGFWNEAIVQYKNALKIKKRHLPTIEALAKACFEIGKKEEARFYKNLRETIYSNLTRRKIEYEIRQTYRTVN